MFHVGERLFAFETCYCRQVVRRPAIVPVPEVPAFIDGIMNLRGRVVSVTDLARLMDLERNADSSTERLIVASNDVTTTAIVVDGVDRIVDIREDEIQHVSPGAPGEAYATGELLFDKSLLVLLSVPRMLESREMQIDFGRSEQS